MILESVKKIVEDTERGPLYLRNLIKEELQNYILNFTFNSKEYNDLIFTGGTCLRRVYGLNRLSEDLDFDYKKDFSIEKFSNKVDSYFKSTVRYESGEYNIANNKNSVYFKFPVLKELELYSDRVPEDIFVRCDFFEEKRGGYSLDNNMITAGRFQFFVNSYDLATMFANKLVAFLERSFYKGKLQKIPFKGRDVYDLYWLMQLSAKSSYDLKVNKERLDVLVDKSPKEVREEVIEKIRLVDNKFLYNDLSPLIESKEILLGFIDSYKDYIPKYVGMVL